MFEDKDERVETGTEGDFLTGESATAADGHPAEVNFTMKDSETDAQAEQLRREQERAEQLKLQRAEQERIRRQQAEQEQLRLQQAGQERLRREQEQARQAQQTQQAQYQQQQAQYRQSTASSVPQGGQSGRGSAGRGRKNRLRDGSLKIRRPYIKAIGCAVICGVIIGGCVIGSFAIGRNMTTANTITISTNEDRLSNSDPDVSGAVADSESTPTASTTSSTSDGDEYTVAQIAEQCGSSVVAITNRSVSEVLTMFGYYEYESQGSGSGVIIGLNDDELLIVTNYHVVEDATELTVCFFDSEDAVYGAQIKGTDPNNDLAVVSVSVSSMDPEVLGAISIATIGDSDAMNVGDGVVAIGNALGLGQSVTSGIISAVNREVSIDDYVANLIQTDAAINPGNSGGALFNMKGELIGINSAKYASEEVEGMGFAIPMSIAQPVIEQLMSQKTRVKLSENYGYLNITGNDISTQMVQSYGMPQGVYVIEATEGGAAANAGIRTGDIITALDGISTPNMDTLRERLQYYEAGETVEVTVSRISGNGYEERNIVVTLENASEHESTVTEDSDTDSDADSYYGNNGSSYYYGNGDISDFFGFGQ